MKETVFGKLRSSGAFKRHPFLWYIGLAYVTQGIAQHFCLIAQPLDYFMLKTLGKNASEVASLLALLMIPWMIKPIYGILSDFWPLCGYRRKSYLALAYGLAGGFYLLSSLTGSSTALVVALFMTAVGMAAGTTIVCGLTLEVGRPSASIRTFQSVQAICYYTASICSFLLGGLLCAKFVPTVAVHSAAVVASLPCLLAAGASWCLVDEAKTLRRKLDFSELRKIGGQLHRRGFLVVALFLCCWSFSPGFGTPLYFHETKVLGFSQLFIGQLGAINSIGMIVGALSFKFLMDKKLSPRKQAVISVVLGTLSTLSYLWLSSDNSAVLLEFFRGFANITAILTVYGLAADVSPVKLESTSIALLISAYNIAAQGGNILGAKLYTYTFHDGFSSLIIISAAATLACLLLVPFLPQKDQYKD